MVDWSPNVRIVHLGKEEFKDLWIRRLMFMVLRSFYLFVCFCFVLR